MEQIIIDSFKGIAPRYGEKLPPGYAETAENCLLYDGKLSPLAKNTKVEDETNKYNSMAYHCQDWLYGNNRFFCPWKIGVLDLLMYKDDNNYLKKKVSWIITETDISFMDSWALAAKVDISFDADSHEIRSAGDDFVVAKLPTGRKFTITGSSDNDGTYTVSSLTAATTGVITVEEDLEDEAAGEAVTLTAPDCIMSANGDFNPPSLNEDTTFVLSGSTSNNGTFTVSSVPTNQYCILPDEAITDEVAGDTVTIKVCKEDYLGQTRQDAPTITIDELWEVDESDDVDAWGRVAPQLNSQTDVYDLVELNGELYGVTHNGGVGDGGKLFKWNQEDAWTQVADYNEDGAQTLYAACVWKDTIYACGRNVAKGGYLQKWNGVDAWEVLIEGITNISGGYSLKVFKDRLFMGAGGSDGERALYRLNSAENAWELVADDDTADSGVIADLVELNDELYGVTNGGVSADNGTLLKWNGHDAWDTVAERSGTERCTSAIVYNGEIYAGTTTNARLLKWNGTNAWTIVAPYLADETIEDLYIFNDKLYGSTSNNGLLLEWNGVDSWIQVAAQKSGQTYIHCLFKYKGSLYAGTSTSGMLFRWMGAEEAYTSDDIISTNRQYMITLTRNVGGHIDESGPSDISDEIDVYTDQIVTIERPAWKGLGTSDYVTHWNIYRIDSQTGAWMLVESVAFATTSYEDETEDVSELGGTPPGYYTSNQGNEIIWDLPQKNLDGITTRPIYGIIFAWKGGTLYWNEPGYPDAWVDFYTMNSPGDIKNCIPREPALAVLTTVGPLRVDGNNPETLQQSGVCGPNPAMSVLGCCETENFEGGVFYLSDSGIAFFNMSSSRIVTDEGFGEQWFKDNIDPSTAVMIEVDKIDYLFNSGGTVKGLIVDFRSEIPIPTTLSETIYGAYRKPEDDELYVMDGAGLQQFGTAAGTKAMTWKSGELMGDHPEEKNFIETELMSDSDVAVTVTNYVDGVSSASAEIAMTTVRGKKLGFLDEKCIGRAAQTKIYKAAHDTLTPSELEITEAIVRYTR
jgi:hypothetical protein